MNHNIWLIERMMQERQETVRREAEIRRRLSETRSPRHRNSLKALVGRRLISWGAFLTDEHDRGCVEA
jgi:hypothetical protein